MAQPDLSAFRDMLGLLKKHGVDFLIVGAHALGARFLKSLARI